MTQNLTTFERGRLMDYTHLPTILTALTATLVAFGGGIKWMLARMDNQDAAEREWQFKEREKLETQFNARITALERLIEGQDHELSRMRTELTAYVRHVGVLEGLLKANGIEAPLLIKPAN